LTSGAKQQESQGSMCVVQPSIRYPGTGKIFILNVL